MGEKSGAFYIAADGGGTKTSFALFGDDGRISERLSLGPCNPNAVGADGVSSVLKEGIDALSKLRGGKPAAFYGGISGVLSSGSAASLENMLKDQAGFVKIEPDIMNVIHSVPGSPPLVAAIAGTGSVAFGYDGSSLRQAGGYGPLLGESGGGSAIGRELVSFLLDAEEAGETDLPLFKSFCGVAGESPRRHLPQLCGRGSGYLASFAPIAIESAENGDDIARSILRRNASRLAERVLLLLSTGRYGARVVLSGGVAKASPLYREMFCEALGPSANVEIPAAEPVEGACRRLSLLLGIGDKIEVRLARSFALPGRGGDSPTEAGNQRSRNFDKMETACAIRLFNDENDRAMDAVRGASGALAMAAECAAKAIGRGGRIIYAGAGTSGRLAVLDASEVPPTFGVPSDRVIAAIAGGTEAVFHAVEGAEDDFDDGFGRMASLKVCDRDMVIGLSASGRARFVLGALEYAKRAGASSAAISSVKGSPIMEAARIAVFLDTGPEVVTGSTRLKAGSAQKAALNMISTIAMAKNGNVRGNLMVNLRPLNEKLKERMRKIVSELAGVGIACADRALKDSNEDIRGALRLLERNRGIQ